ncbi:putative endoglucanase [Pestalotiopsis sp. NC0098]|nr:putative endoglucanase [Pestalotiopsis sp. NC0098]
MKNLAILAFATGSLPTILAHYFFPHLIVNNNFTGYYEYVREDTQGYMPFKNGYESTDLRCNTGSQDFASKTGVYKVKAGDELGFGTDFNALIQHPGPMQVYLSKAPGDVREYDGSGDWFKIWELGPQQFSSDGIEWGVTNIGNFTFTLPEETPAGQYLVRIEHIGVHGAGDFGGAEFFFNCAQIEVESESTAVPSPVVQIPGLYTGYEPGIEFYMYRPWIVNYTMPGPVPWPNAVDANITASGVSVAPTDATWTLPAVTNSASATSVQSSVSEAITTTASGSVTTSGSAFASSDSVVASTLETILALSSQTASASSAVASAEPTKLTCGSRKHRRS